MTSTREQPHIQLSAVCQVSDTLQNAEPTGRDNETVILEGNASKCPQRSQDMKVNAWNLAWVSPKKLLLQNPYAQALNICHWLALFFSSRGQTSQREVCGFYFCSHDRVP